MDRGRGINLDCEFLHDILFREGEGGNKASCGTLNMSVLDEACPHVKYQVRLSVRHSNRIL